MTRTGIFGGSFNPIHKGHTALARQIIRQRLVDELWFVVSPQNPLKADSNLMDDTLRLKMVQAATRNIKNVSASDFEFHLPRPSYMFQTLTQLTKTYPDRAFTLIIGADNWCLFDNWYNWQEILAQWPLIIYPREGYTIKDETLPQSVTMLHCPLYPISSTEIREKLKNNKSVERWMNKNVLKILSKTHLTAFGGKT